MTTSEPSLALRCPVRDDWQMPIPSWVCALATLPLLYALLVVLATILDARNAEVLALSPAVAACVVALFLAVRFARLSRVEVGEESVRIDGGTTGLVVIAYDLVRGFNVHRSWIRLRTVDGRRFALRPGLLHREDVIDFLRSRVPGRL